MSQKSVSVARWMFILSALLSNPLAYAEDSLSDHLATVFNVEGNVKILKPSASDWAPAVKGMILQVGDQILTGENSHLEIVYDERFLNIARIEANTRGEFRSIEPTDLFLEDGTIFNALDGLNGASYSVSTPTAVAAVRGTHFEVMYDAATKVTEAAVIPDTKEYVSSIELTPVKEDGSSGVGLLIEEGKEAELTFENVQTGETPPVQNVDPAKVEEQHEKLESMMGSAAPSEGETSEGEQPEKKEDDQKAAGNNPPGGGSGGDGGAESGDSSTGNDTGTVAAPLMTGGPISQGLPPADSSNTLLLTGQTEENNLVPPAPEPAEPTNESQVDLLVDNLIPRSDVTLTEETETAGGQESKKGENQEEGKDGSKKSEGELSQSEDKSRSGTKPEDAPDRAPDMGQALNFLSIGGAFNPAMGGQPGEQMAFYNEFFTGLGLTPEQVEKMERMFEHPEGRPIDYDHPPGDMPPQPGDGGPPWMHHPPDGDSPPWDPNGPWNDAPPDILNPEDIVRPEDIVNPGDFVRPEDILRGINDDIIREFLANGTTTNLPQSIIDLLQQLISERNFHIQELISRDDQSHSHGGGFFHSFYEHALNNPIYNFPNNPSPLIDGPAQDPAIKLVIKDIDDVGGANVTDVSVQFAIYKGPINDNNNIQDSGSVVCHEVGGNMVCGA